MARDGRTMIEEGKHLKWALFQTRAGHSSITTTRKYYLAVYSEDFDIINEWLNNILARESDN
jgi:integrase